MSDASFVIEHCLKKLGVESITVNVSLSTLSTVFSNKVSGLRIKGYHSSDTFDMSVMYSRSSIPADRNNIPTFDRVKH